MTPLTRHTRRMRSGSASTGVVLALAALQLMVVGVVMGGARDQDVTSKRLDALRAQYAAEAGVNMAAREFAQNADEDGDGTTGTISTKTALPRATFSVGKTVAGSTSTFTVNAASGEAARRAQLVGVETSTAAGLSPGVKVEGWELTPSPSTLADVPFSSTPKFVGWAYDINIPSGSGASFWAGGQSNKFGARFSATLTIPTTGSWTFTLGSDDGSDLSINGATIINHDGAHGYSTKAGTVSLAAGTHTLVVRYFEKNGNNALTLAWSGPGVPSTTMIPRTAFSADLTDIPAVAAYRTIVMDGDGTASSCFIDGFNSGSGVYGGANVDGTNAVVALNSTSDEACSLDDRAQVRGSVRVGQGGDPSDVIDLEDGASITGTQTAAVSHTAVMGRVALPTFPATSGSVSYTSGTTTISTNRRYNNLTVSGATTVLEISGSVALRVDGTFSVSGNAQVTLLPGATLDVYAYGITSLTGTAGINANTGTPARCRYFVMNTSSSNLTLSTSAVLCAQVVGQQAELDIAGTGSPPAQFIGTFAGERITLTSRGQVHADLAGRTGSGGSGSGGRSVRFTSWAMVP